jgi:hypothetical protein
MKRISAVPHSNTVFRVNTVFRDILKLVPWTEFDQLMPLPRPQMPTFLFSPCLFLQAHARAVRAIDQP